MTQESAPPLNEILLKISEIKEKQDLLCQLIQESQANSVPKSKNKKTKETKRVNVNAQILALLIKYSDKIWTANELAEKIGCTGSAVKKTSAWKGHQKQKVEARQQCSIRRGFKDKNGNADAAIEDDEIDD